MKGVFITMKKGFCRMFVWISIVLMCSMHDTYLYAEHLPVPPAHNNFTIWAHSDIQPENNDDRKYYELALDDVKNNFPPVSMAIVAGDIVQGEKSKNTFLWYLEVRKKVNIPYWYEIAGNHDARNFANYFHYVRKPLCYAVKQGNVAIIFLSDEVNSSPTEISDTTFEWWKKLVTENQDKTIITVTHAYLKKSALFGHSFYRSNILKSERFVRVLKQSRVDLWLAGHTSAPDIGSNKMNVLKELHNIMFLNISSIRSDMGIDVSSRLIIFEQGSDIMTIKTRNHEEKKFPKDRVYRIKLRAPFKNTTSKPEILVPKGMLIPEDTTLY
jgi:hypothetical protein